MIPIPLRFMIAGALLPGCLFGNNKSDQCLPEQAMTIDTGASVDHAAGVDPGYYASYTAGGAWHLEWTCDTKLSAQGCNFTGSIVVDTPAGGAKATCFQCEPEDILNVTQGATQATIDFDTVTSTGIDGVDFVGVPGHSISIDLSINSLYQNDLVFVPSLGRTAVPDCMPIDLTPSAP
jgi:hypothetical protein